MEEQANRPHRKTKERKKHTGDRNPKAFGYANPGRLAKQAVRSHDVRNSRLETTVSTDLYVDQRETPPCPPR